MTDDVGRAAREDNPRAQWWNHDGDPFEESIARVLQVQMWECGTYGAHNHFIKDKPIGTATIPHHHHDFTCIYQAGRNSLLPQLIEVRETVRILRRTASRLQRSITSLEEQRRQQQVRYDKDMYNLAKWLLLSGFPFDMVFKDAPPEYVKAFVRQVILDDPEGNLHGEEIKTLDEVEAFVQGDNGWAHGRD